MTIIIDLEMTCCDGDEFSKDDMEIIEIGAVKIGPDGVLDSFSCFVRPVIHPRLTDFCVDLLGISQSDVDGALKFSNAWVDQFKQWLRGSRSFCSWGVGDLRWLQRECVRHSVIFPFEKHGNLFKAFGSGQRRVLNRNNLQWVGQRHRALSDAQTYAMMIAAEHPKITYREIR